MTRQFEIGMPVAYCSIRGEKAVLTRNAKPRGQVSLRGVWRSWTARSTADRHTINTKEEI